MASTSSNSNPLFYPARSDAELDNAVRQFRGDPSHSAYCWIAHTGMTSDVAPEAWLKAVEGTITNRHNHIVVRSDQHGLGWLSWAGLGSLMEPIRDGAGKGGCLHPTREIALDKALARVRALRAEAISLLESRLDGWAWEAISLRINPSSTMRCLSGWQPLEVEICVHEPDDSEPKGSYQTPVVERIADPLPGRFAGYRAEDGC